MFFKSLRLKSLLCMTELILELKLCEVNSTFADVPTCKYMFGFFPIPANGRLKLIVYSLKTWRCHPDYLMGAALLISFCVVIFVLIIPVLGLVCDVSWLSILALAFKSHKITNQKKTTFPNLINPMFSDNVMFIFCPL